MRTDIKEFPTMLKGNVTARNVQVGLASELLIAWQRERQYKKRWRTALKITASPWGIPRNFAIRSPMPALTIGTSIAKEIRKAPVFCKSFLLAATSPMSSKKR